VIGADEHLPPLRQDLRILPAGRLASGAPGWVIFDPVMHRYF
jgi:putative peptide zinc metalloprotease protein